MSGGRFNYVDCDLRNEMFGWVDKPHNVMEDVEISELVWDVLDLIHAFDYYAESDTDRETYIKAKNDFKKKWFRSNRKIRIQKYIDNKLDETKKEIAEMIGDTE